MSASTCFKIDTPDERLTVIAQRRLAAQQEIQRLRVEQTIRPQAPGNKTLTERGSLTLSNITVPLKMDVVHRAAKGKTSSCLYPLRSFSHHPWVHYILKQLVFFTYAQSCLAIVSVSFVVHHFGLLNFFLTRSYYSGYFLF